MRGLENPFPYFSEATNAASLFFQAQREYLKLSAELRAKREAKRAALLVAAAVLANIMLILTLFWVSHAIYDAGLPAWAVALASLTVFGGAAGLCGYLGIQAGKPPVRKPKSHAAEAAPVEASAPPIPTSKAS